MTARTLDALLRSLITDVGLLKRRTAKIPRPTSPTLLASTGDVKVTAREGTQSGWILAAGGTFAIVDYPELYDVLGTRFNTGGEPAGTFRVPNVSTAPLGSGLTALIKT